MERKEQKLELIVPRPEIRRRLDSALRFGAGAVYLAGREVWYAGRPGELLQ